MGVSTDDRGVLVTCPACGTMNRHVYQSLDRPIRCGHCKTTLPRLGSPVDVPTALAFEALVSQSPMPMVVDF
jgi:hypothetical protein